MLNIELIFWGVVIVCSYFEGSSPSRHIFLEWVLCVGSIRFAQTINPMWPRWVGALYSTWAVVMFCEAFLWMARTGP